jgi:hypothetical protein
MHRLAVIRSLTHPDAAHEPGTAHMQTGYAFRAGANYPSIGSVVGHECRERARRVGLPPAIVIPRGTLGAGHLGPAHNPFEVAGNPNDPAFAVQDLALPEELGRARLVRRARLLARLDEPLRDHPAEIHGAIDRFNEQALRLLTSPRAQQAFEVQREPVRVRERYGRTVLGQSLLLARRLVEADVPFITINDEDWDHHVNIYPNLRTRLPPLDRGVSTLIDDLATRGLLESTLVIVLGEFGRTPRINVNRGRDHWPRSFSVVLAGGGVRGGQTIGASDGEGAFVADRPVTPEDLAYSIYTLLGVDPDKELPTILGRRIQIVRDGHMVRELV